MFRATLLALVAGLLAVGTACQSDEFPAPIPGFMRWLNGLRERGELDARELSLLDHSTWPSKKDAANPLSEVLLPLAARYFLQEKRSDGKPIDPVARFHLGNGARLQRLNWLADLSERGLEQSAGMMVNYLYDLDYIERNHEAYAEQGVIAASSSVTKLVPSKPAPPVKERETA